MNSMRKTIGMLSILGNSWDSGSRQGEKLVLSPPRGNWRVRFEE
jgi:hypothetical protein